MRIARLLLAFALVLLVASSPSGAQDIRPRLLVQARASDAVGAVLFEANAQAESRLDDLRRALQDARGVPGAGRATTQSAPQPSETHANPGAPSVRAKTPTYRELFAHAVRGIANDKQHTTDPSFDNLTDAALFQEMTSLQLYNQRQFMRFARVCGQIQALEQEMKTMPGSKGTPSTRPAIPSLADLPARIDAQIAAPRRSAEWSRLRGKLHNAVVARMPNTPAARGIIQPRLTRQNPPAPVPGPMDDPRFQRWYYGPQDPFNGWVSPYADSFQVTPGGGFYNRSDTRVNIDPDTRTNSVFDRRVNIDNDRRLNVHEDPRENF